MVVLSNKEGYSDPTAETAIANVMREQVRKTQKKHTKGGNEMYNYDNGGGIRYDSQEYREKIMGNADGGPGSGNWGHGGRPGKVGGSSGGGGKEHRTGTKEKGFSSEAKKKAEAKKAGGSKNTIKVSSNIRDGWPYEALFNSCTAYGKKTGEGAYHRGNNILVKNGNAKEMQTYLDRHAKKQGGEKVYEKGNSYVYDFGTSIHGFTLSETSEGVLVEHHGTAASYKDRNKVVENFNQNKPSFLPDVEI